MNPQHALMQELAAARHADLLREAEADRAAAIGGCEIDGSSVARRLGRGAASLVLALQERRGRVAPRPAPHGA